MFFINGNQKVEFRVMGYQFPKLAKRCEYDSNWLNIHVKVKSLLGDWEATDPSLLTNELQDLSDWFAALSEDRAQVNRIGFIEPNISFEYLQNLDEKIIKAAGKPKKKTIKIMFDWELRPSSQASDDIDYHLNFEFSNAELKKIALELRVEGNKFPMR